MLCALVLIRRRRKGTCVIMRKGLQLLIGVALLVSLCLPAVAQSYMIQGEDILTSADWDVRLNQNKVHRQRVPVQRDRFLCLWGRGIEDQR